MPIESSPEVVGVESKKRHIWRRALGALTGVAVGVACLVGFQKSQERMEAALEALKAMPGERNTCELTEARLVTDAAGRLGVKTLVRVDEKVKPEASNELYDGWFMDAQFEDVTGNLVSGVALGWPDGQLMFVGGDSSSSRAVSEATFDVSPSDFPSDLYPKWESGVYKVYHQNAVKLALKGPMVSDAFYMKDFRVQCGEFEIKDGAIQILHTK